MYRVGDYVSKMSSGVCRVSDIVKMAVPGTKDQKDYYLLIPEGESRSRIYVPVDNEVSSLRPVMNRDEALEMIRKIPDLKEAEIKEEKTREKSYRELVNSGDPEKLASVLKTIWGRRKEREITGKRITAMDERYFKQAQDLLYAELAFSTGKDLEEICRLVTESAENKK